jgi:ankyrin repeat protein
MSRPNSFKRTSLENEIFQNIISLLKYKNFNPSKEEDLKELLSMAIDPSTKSINSEYLLLFLLRHINSENEHIFYEKFFQCCELGELQSVKILLENDLDINRQNEQGETPLHIAVSKGDIDLVNLLVKYEPDPSIAEYKDNFTVMNYAKLKGNKIIIKIIEDLYEKHNKQVIQNEIVNCINNGMNDVNDNMNSFLNKNNNSLFMSRNDTNLEIQNYNGDIVSIITDENKSINSFSSHLNKNIPNSKIKNNNENKYVNTQTIINESDYYDESSPPRNKNKILFKNYNSSNKESPKNSKKILIEKKSLFSSFKRKEENLNNNNRLSINPSYVQSLTTCHTLNKEHFESISPKLHNISLKDINLKASLYKFIKEINLPKEYANILIDNGFDILEVLICQTKKSIAITNQNLKDIGIRLPGERAKILLHLEEIAGNFDFPINKDIVYDNSNNFTTNNYENSSLFKFLNSINMEKYMENFIKAGYYNSEILFLQMNSKQPLNEDILVNDFGVRKSECRFILEKLSDEANKYIKSIKNKEENKNTTIILEENNNNKYCDICLVF